MLLHKDKMKAFRKKCRLLPLAAALLFASCGDYFFPEFTVLDSRIQDGKALVDFSAPISPSSAKQNFLFAKDGAQAEGKALFSGSRMTFIPDEAIDENHSYAILVYSGAMDVNGNALQKDYKKVFHTKDDLSPPEVVSVKALLDEEENTRSLEIQFNKKISEESFLKRFSIEPKRDFFANWDEGCERVAIAFKEFLPERTLHSIKIEKGLLDARNNKSLNDFYWSWANKSGAEEPRCSVYARAAGQSEAQEIFGAYEEADYGAEILLSFNKAVLADSLSAAIRVEPETSFSVEPIYEADGNICKSAKLRFTESPKWNSERTLFIGAEIKDRSGLCMQERKIAVKNNSEKSRPPKIEFMALEISGDYLLLSGTENYQSAFFPIEEYPATENKRTSVYFVFSASAFSRRVEKFSALEGISVSCNSCAALALTKIESLSQDEFPNRPEFFQNGRVRARIQKLRDEGKNLCAVRFEALFRNRELDGKAVAGLIEFSADEKIRDDQNNCMEEGARFVCNKL